MSTYDNSRFQAMQHMVFGDSTGITIAGTNAANTTLFRLRMCSPITFITGTITALTGGTAAGGPVIAFQKSLAGTGAGVTFASYSFNTNADGSSVDLGATLTQTTFASGDHVLMAIMAGTNASTPKINACLCFKESFSSSGNM